MTQIANFSTGTVTISARCTQLTGPARKALLDIGTNRQGALPTAGVTVDALSELSRCGLIGPGGGLTRTGALVREKLVDQLMNELF